MRKFMLAVAVVAMVAMATVATAQTISTDFNTVIMAVTNPLTVEGQQELGADLQPGTTYYVAPTGQINPPDASGNTDIGGPLVWAVTGQGGTHVAVTFTLPDRFYSAETGAAFPISYGPVDGLWDNSATDDGTAGNAFDPRNQWSDYLSVDGAATAFLAFTTTVPGNIPAAEDYTATFYCTVSATGL